MRLTYEDKASIKLIRH